MMYFIWLMEWILRATVIRFNHGLDSIYTFGPTPGSDYAPIAIGLLLIFFVISLKVNSE
jgi:hypothetical protein